MKNNQKGFVLTLAILMLVVMSIMGVTLVVLLSNDVRQNDSKSDYQQTLYAAETAASLGKNRLQALVTASSALPQAQGAPWVQTNAPTWCRPNRFSKIMNQDPAQIYIVDPINIPVTLLSDELDRPIGTLTGIERTHFGKYQIYYFITNASTNNGTAANATNPVSTLTTRNANIVSGGSSGTTAAEKTSYKSGAGIGAQAYTIYACARNRDTNIISAIDVTVTLAMQ